jgi:hypothetical protein
MLLITIFVELRVVVGGSRTRAGSPQAVSRRPCSSLEKNGMVRAWHGRSMANVNQTRPHCVNQMGKKHSKPLAARHGRGTAWAWHAMCESAFRFNSLPQCPLMKHTRFILLSNTQNLKVFTPNNYKCVYFNLYSSR